MSDGAIVDTTKGASGDDFLLSSDGDDFLNGGSGEDTVVYSGQIENYLNDFGQLEILYSKNNQV